MYVTLRHIYFSSFNLLAKTCFEVKVLLFNLSDKEFTVTVLWTNIIKIASFILMSFVYTAPQPEDRIAQLIIEKYTTPIFAKFDYKWLISSFCFGNVAIMFTCELECMALICNLSLNIDLKLCFFFCSVFSN